MLKGEGGVTGRQLFNLSKTLIYIELRNKGEMHQKVNFV